MSDEIRNNKAENRFEMDAGGDLAVAYYRLEPGVMTLTHTETPHRLQGRALRRGLFAAPSMPRAPRG